MKANHKIMIDRLPNGWCIRRADGTIAAIQGIRDLGEKSALKLAAHRASRMDLSALPRQHNQNVSLGRLPKVQHSLRHRYYSGRPISQQWMIYVSFLLPLATLGTGMNRRNRWATASVGNIRDLNPERIDIAWRQVYAKWAWATSQKSETSAEQVYSLAVPDDVESYLDLIDLPPAPSVEMLWAGLGYDYLTGRDTMARQRERLKENTCS